MKVKATEQVQVHTQEKDDEQIGFKEDPLYKAQIYQMYQNYWA